MIITFKYRIKDANVRKHLRRQARAVNQVWNFCCATQRQAEDRWKQGATGTWLSKIDLDELCRGSSRLLGIHADTITLVCWQFVRSHRAKRSTLRFRSSGGPRRALGWVPFRAKNATIDGSCVTYLKRKYYFWKSRELYGTPKTGAFVEDACGRWYVTFQCETDEVRPTGNGKVGIDLGLKAVATLSDGTTIPALQHYRKYEAALAKAQRSGNKRRVRAIHAKIANSRLHHLHEWSTKIARENSLICVGNVSASKLVKTTMAKSILDVSWGILKSQLAYKARRHQAAFIVVDEAFTTRTCSSCGSVPDSSPKGMNALGIRSWECSDCGASHDRDVNAARNILKIGLEHQPLAGEIRMSSGRC